MVIDLDCPQCNTDEEVVLAEKLTGTQRRLRCETCGVEWLRGEPTRPKPSLPTLADIRRRFPRPEDVDPKRLAHAQVLKEDFLRRNPVPAPEVTAYWDRYRAIFSAEGLPDAAPQDLKDFANSNVGANPGNMSVFNKEWHRLGAQQSAVDVRESIEYLLRGPEHIPLEDRLTNLIAGDISIGFKGFRESLLTKVLCIVYPERFLTITKYTGEAGKREIARALWGMELPDPERTTWTIGRLVLWSNDLVFALIGEGFTTGQHAAEFLWSTRTTSQVT
ncbi:hypothetical protein RDV89_00910 [Nocardioides zeae]|uniref:TFIIB-type domain-containing protein n=1 Tax=Nocardioides imazamoxiresistens TaxID=3231893 RepID=A0ABU3PRT9_9ACTN|nr:hypothetical protein [Nocardioides zeae]MDT9591606.1 hypothetical protein [Nocardioides zeae]